MATTLYIVGGHYHIGSNPAKYRAIATFLDRAAAIAFVEAESEGDLELDEIPLIDDYGFPFKPSEFPAIRPRVFAELC